MRPPLEQIVVVQLSDLHYGCRRGVVAPRAKGRVPHDRLLCERLQDAFRDIRRHYAMASSDRLHVLVSGDLTSGGATEEFELVRQYLHEQRPDPVDLDAYGLGIPERDEVFVSIPGNHDHWNDDCMPVVPAFSPWIYQKQFERTPRRVWWSPSNKLKLEIYGVDSASGLADKETNSTALGKLSTKELITLRSNLDKSNDEEPLAPGAHRVRVICCHHSLVYNKGEGPPPGIVDRTIHANTFDAGSTAALLDIAHTYDVAAVFTGHVHKFWFHQHPVGSRFVCEVTCSTSLQKKSGQNGFWVHQIALIEGKPKARSIPYSWNPAGSQFERREDEGYKPPTKSSMARVEPVEWL
jgi:hypothetical protein